MVFFKCFTCNITWTKVVDDGCPICNSPCQLIEAFPVSGQSSEGASVTSPRTSPCEREREPLLSIACDEARRPRDVWDHVASTFTILDESTDFEQSAVDREPTGNEEYEDEAATVTSFPDVSKSDGKNDAPSSYTISDDEAQPSRYCPRQHAITRTPFQSDLGSRIIQEERGPSQQPRPSTNVLQGAQTLPLVSEVAVRHDPKTKIGDAVATTPKGKKNKKRSKQGGQKKSKKTMIKPAKFVAQLEMPDPVPEPGEKKTENEWNRVVRKGATKGFMGLHRQNPSSGNTGKFVNATAYDFRRIEDGEEPTPDSSVVDVRFGMGSAKHDVRRIIPRSALE